jgi:predicted GH43/DUF377 family glycosyl hydrolase
VARLFVAGQEVVGGNEARPSGVVERLLGLDEAVVERRLEDVLQRFGGRHRELTDIFRRHAARIENRLDPATRLTEARRLLLGATFTHEYAVEAASLCNPSMVAHPDQSDAPPGGVRFIMSVRGIGEGHRSSIGFRTGTVTAAGEVTIDEPGPFATLGDLGPGIFEREAFRSHLHYHGTEGESADVVLDHLAETFTADELEGALAVLAAQSDTRRNAATVAAELRTIAARSYRTHFPAEVPIAERVLWPATAAESHGIEDARFVRFVEDDGAVTYYATYTAWDGTGVSVQRLETTDFCTFASSPLVGTAAANKGLALFPRRIGGRFAAMTRHDRETNAVALSTSLGYWPTAVTCEEPERDWEIVQLGNCGPPIETEAGWLVLTHGVGPMRTYSIGALLLDIDDPTKVLGTLQEPLMTPAPDEQDGYVPNVVYSCGALLHDETLVIPYGVADTSVAVATVSLPALLDALR